MHTPKKSGNTSLTVPNLRRESMVTHTRVIQLTVNHTLAFENSLLNTLMCMVDLTCLQLDQTY